MTEPRASPTDRMTSRATMERLGRLANHVLAQSSPAAAQQVVPHDASTGAGATTAGSQFADVVATLHNYFNGGHTGNAELSRGTPLVVPR
eukprot:COSAG06_NODE_4516_length_4188_cov_1.828320_1_plen_90_part_00